MLRIVDGIPHIRNPTGRLQPHGAYGPLKLAADQIHIASRDIPAALSGTKRERRSFNVIRAIWRSVAGEWGGNIDLQRRKFNSQKSAAQVAAYIAKYIGKTFEESGMESGKNRWTVRAGRSAADRRPRNGRNAAPGNRGHP